MHLFLSTIAIAVISLFVLPSAAYARPLLIVYQHEGLTFTRPPERQNAKVETLSLIFSGKGVLGKKTFESMEATLTTLPVLVQEPTPTFAPSPTASKKHIRLTSPTTTSSSTSPATIISSKPSPTPTQTKALSKTPTPTPIKPTATPTVVATTASSTTMSNPGGLDPEKLFSMSNSYRSSKGLPAFQKDPRVCEVARVRAPAIEAEIRNGVMHSGLKAMGLPYWITENIISYSTEEQAFNWWVNDTIHREQLEGNFTYSCVACSGFACAQEFTNFIAK